MDKYEEISEKALSTPITTEKLFELKEEIEKIVENVLPEMENESKVLLRKFLFVADYMQVSPIVSKLQSQTIQWTNRMPYVIEEHQNIIRTKAAEFKEALKVCMFVIYENIRYVACNK